MKCPKCPHNQRVSMGMKCDQCGYQFSFNPKEPASLGMTDGRFLAAIRSASQNGTAYFTRNQLYGSYCRRQKKPVIPGIVMGCLFAAFGVAAVVGNVVPAAAVTFLISAIIFLATFLVPLQILPSAKFMRLIDRWLADGKPIDNLITSPLLVETAASLGRA